MGGDNPFLLVADAAMISLLVILFYAFQSRQVSGHARTDVNEYAIQKRFDELEQMRNMKENDSFFQKLADGLNVSILIVGDSIGAGTGTGAETANGTWYTLLREELWQQYHVRAELTNGNTSYAGYARVASLKDQQGYDLAIICYGENDAKEDFSLYYESIIRTIRRKYPDCSVLSILESSQRAYTEKMQIIQQLSDAYGYLVVDTIAPFLTNYDMLTGDGIHPNDKGQQIYFEEVFSVISKGVEEYRGKDPDMPSPVNASVADFDAFKAVTVDEFERIGARSTKTYVLCSTRRKRLTDFMASISAI